MIKNFKKTLKRQDAQSIVEYLILVAIVIAALMAFLAPGGVFEQTHNSTISAQADDIANAAAKIFF